jgi:hypothetical protein
MFEFCISFSSVVVIAKTGLCHLITRRSSVQIQCAFVVGFSSTLAALRECAQQHPAGELDFPLGSA